MNNETSDDDFLNNNTTIPKKKKIIDILYENDKQLESSGFRSQMEEIISKSEKYWNKNLSTYDGIDGDTLTESKVKFVKHVYVFRKKKMYMFCHFFGLGLTVLPQLSNT